MVVKNPGDLQSRVARALRGQSLAAARRLTIEVDDGGVVTLRGTVSSFYARQVAVHGCRRVPGVMAVVDEISVER